MPGAARGHSIDTIPTPALVLDATKVRRNIARMADYTKGVGIANRPHTKTHKSVAIAGLQLASGAVGLLLGAVRAQDVRPLCESWAAWADSRLHGIAAAWKGALASLPR